MNPIISAAAVVTAIGTIVGGYVHMDNRHAPMSVMDGLAFDRIRALVDQGKREGPKKWICDGIENEFIELCTRNKDHYLCRDGRETLREFKAEAGCS